MRLTFDFEYEDFSDFENWLPRLESLKNNFSTWQDKNPEQETLEAVLDGMEANDELMRYYVFTHDYAALKPVMYLQQRLLAIALKRGNSPEILFFDMNFARINGMLYRIEGKNQQGAAGYQEACAAADKCFAAQRNSRELLDAQKLYIGWNCAETVFEAAQCYMDVMDMDAVRETAQNGMEMLNALSSALGDAHGLMDRAAEMYSVYGGMLFQNGMLNSGVECFQNSIRLLEQLGRDGDFWLSRSIWQKSVYSLQVFTATQNTALMNSCIKEAEQLDGTLDTARDNAIVQAACGLLLAQQGAWAQSQGQFAQATSFTEQCVSLLENARMVLEEDCRDKSDYYKEVITSVLNRIYGSYVGALEMLGVMHYYNENRELSKQLLNKALTLLGENYRLAEFAAILIRAECNQYMMLIALDENQADRAFFYGEQAAVLSHEAGSRTMNPAAIGIEIAVCATIAELYLYTKKKAEAARYAEQGIQACGMAERASTKVPQLELKASLERSLKKAKRRFF
ncbi:MAG: hypothetical protein LUH07_03760 [Lachnospiraceae bacterium]|nr:hypothetical protein [Lachnospiraceae bacterium]